MTSNQNVRDGAFSRSTGHLPSSQPKTNKTSKLRAGESREQQLEAQKRQAEKKQFTLYSLFPASSGPGETRTIRSLMEGLVE